MGDSLLLAFLITVAILGLAWTGFPFGEAILLGVLCGLFAWFLGRASAP